MHTLWHKENYICCLVCSITHTPTHTHMISFPSRMQRALQQKNVPPPTHTITCISFHYRVPNITIHICMQAGYQSANIQQQSPPSIRPSRHPLPPFISSPASLHPSLHTCQAYSKVRHLNYPARTHTQAHTCTKSEEGSVIGREDKRGRGWEQISRYPEHWLACTSVSDIIYDVQCSVPALSSLHYLPLCVSGSG